MAKRPYSIYEDGKFKSTLLNIDPKGGFIENRIIVKEASDLVDIDPSKLYIIDGRIDMGTQQIFVPSGGFFATGLGFNVSFLTSSEENYTMFVNKVGENSGDVRIRDMEVSVSGTGSKVFNLDNQGQLSSVEVENSNFGSFSFETPSLGILSNYRQTRMNNTALIRVADGIEYNGTWVGGALITETILLAIPDNANLFKEGVGLVFQGSFFSSLNALSVGTNVTVFDFQESNFTNDRGFALNGARFKAGSDPVPNLPINSTKRFFQSCTGVKNTRIGSGWKSTTEVSTNLSTNISAKINGTTIYNNEIHFNSTTNNAFTYLSTIEDDFFVSGSITIDGGPNDVLVLEVRRWNNSTSDYTIVEDYSRSVTNVVGNDDLAFFTVGTPVTLKELDRVELWIKNTTDGTDVTMVQGSFIRIKREA